MAARLRKTYRVEGKGGKPLGSKIFAGMRSRKTILVPLYQELRLTGN